MSTIQRLFRRFADSNLLSHSPAVEVTKAVSRRRKFLRNQRQMQSHPFARFVKGHQKNGALEFAKFALLSIATLPFTLWLAQFSYDYYYRVELCLEALNQEDQELRIRHRKKNERKVIPREAQLNQVKTLLSKDPHDVVLVAGVNESGKSQFVSEVLRSINSSNKRGVTHIQLAQLVDSVSTFTYVLVNSFNLQWLSLRYSLVDVLPFAGSEILVMKERFSDRDLAQALNVVTEALKKHSQRQSKQKRPIIVIDGLAEGKSWARTQEGKQCLERLFQWFIYVTKERQLAHIVLTGNEELVLSLTDQNRLTRGHVKVIGLGDLQKDEARELVLQEIPDASAEEIRNIIDAFGGFIHDVRGVARDIHDQLGLGGPVDAKRRARIVEDTISTRCRMQFERVTAAFAKGNDERHDASSNNTGEASEEEEMDPYLDPLKAAYSEAQASQASAALSDADDTVSYTKLQLWQTLQMLVDADDGAVAFAELRDDVFDGDQTPLLELMDADVLGFEIEDSQSVGFSWKVKPASPALYGAFKQIVSDSSLKERFEKVEQNSNRHDEIREIARERMNIKKERKELEERKAAIQSTVELGEKLDRKAVASSKLTAVYDALVNEEHEALVRDYELREKMKFLERSRQEESLQNLSNSETEVQQHLKNALLQIMMKKHDTTSPDNYGVTALFSAFQELDSSKDGTFTAEDVVRVIKAYTGNDVKLKDARRLVEDWDSDNDKNIDFDEFVSWYSYQSAKKSKNKR